jgi:O-antigen/teichoic acid export membrane protein
LFSSISTAIRLVTSFASAKIMAIYLGPAGLGLLGQFSSFISIVLNASTGAINNGTTKYLAEFTGNETKQLGLIKASFIVTTCCSLITGLITILFANYWSVTLLSNAQYSYIFVLFGASILLYSFFSITMSVINGLQYYKLFNIISTISSIISLGYSVLLIKAYSLEGALIALATSQSIIFVLFLFSTTVLKRGIQIYRSSVDRTIYKKLFQFSLMTVFSVMALPVAQIIIRKFLLWYQTSIDMGYYEAINRVSTIYLTLITTTLSIYYLPKLSAITDNNLLRKEIFTGYKLIIPVTICLLLIIYFLKQQVIRIVFAPSFEAMESYFLPQIIGDFFKIASWLLAYQMLAKAMTKMFIITEGLFTISLVLLSYLFIKKFGGIGSVYAYAANYTLYFFAMIYLFKDLILKRSN